MIQGDDAIRLPFQDRLDRTRVARALGRLLGAKSLETPLTVGILGGWGTGKTSLMRLLQQELAQDAGPDGPLTLWFDAWAYARQEQSLWRALLLRVTGELGKQARGEKDEDKVLSAKLETLETSLYRSVTLTESAGFKMNWGSALPLTADLLLRYATAGLSDVASDPKTGEGPLQRFARKLTGDDAKEATKLIERKVRESYVEEVRSLEQFRATFEEALALVGVGPSVADGGKVEGQRRRLYVFVDDLDRCLPEDAVSAVEAIKLFLDVPGCVFVLGMDPEVIESGISARYAPYFKAGNMPFRPGDYLDKVVQLPFTLPPLHQAQVAKFLDDIVARDSAGLVSDVRDLIEIAVPDNPRALKRALNVLRLAAELGECAEPGEHEGDVLRGRRRKLAKIILMQVCFPEAYRSVVAQGAFKLRQFQSVSAGANKAAAGEDFLTGRLAKLLRGDDFGKDEADDAENAALMSLTQAVSTAARAAPGPPKAPERQV